jgi:hypothetical protein
MDSTKKNYDQLKIVFGTVKLENEQGASSGILEAAAIVSLSVTYEAAFWNGWHAWTRR